MKFVPLNVHAFCAQGARSWALAFGSRGGGLRLWLSAAEGVGTARVVAEISEPRQIDAIVDRIGDMAMTTRDVAVELFDLLSTLAGNPPEDHCKAFLVSRMEEWIVRTRMARVEHGNVA